MTALLRRMRALAGCLLNAFAQPSTSSWPVHPMTREALNQLFYQQRLVSRIDPIDGNIVECGVGQGRSLHYWCVLLAGSERQRHIYGYDSFAGFPEPSPEDLVTGRATRRGEWNTTSPERVIDFLEAAGWQRGWVDEHVTLVKGFFDATLSTYAEGPLALLHVDADLYQSTKDVLESLYGHVAPGGVIAFDEYMGGVGREYQKWPGAKRAVDEFLDQKGIEIQHDTAADKFFAVKPSGRPD